MRLTRYAHACFGVEDPSGQIWLFDPYRPEGLGGRFSIPAPDIIPHRILITHCHEDHSWRTRAWAEVPVWESDRKTDEATLTTLAVPHDAVGGTHMGFSRSLKLEIHCPGNSNFKVIHSGDVGDSAWRDLVPFCKDADLLLLPAGGKYTLGPGEAMDLAKESGARRTVLMHFREPGIDLPMLTPEEAFAQLNDPITIIESGVMDLPTARDGREAEVFWLAPLLPAS